MVSSVLSQIQPAAAHDFRGQSSLQKIKYYWAGLKSTKEDSKYFFYKGMNCPFKAFIGEWTLLEH